MTGFAGPAPHPWGREGERDRAVGVIAWLVLLVIIIGTIVWMLWPVIRSDVNPARTGPAQVSERECVQTGGRLVHGLPGTHQNVCVWPPSDY